MDAILNYKPDPKDDLYTILGCDELSSHEQILTEYRIRAVECHPDKNRDDPSAQERFQELLRAKDILSDEKQRSDYDLWRRSGIQVGYNEWVARRESLKPSMHWFVRTKKEPMIDAPPPAATTSGSGDASPAHAATTGTEPYLPQVIWNSDQGSETARKFRSYEI